jgi:hypothetical protein
MTILRHIPELLADPIVGTLIGWAAQILKAWATGGWAE